VTSRYVGLCDVSGIVYCFSRKETEAVADALKTKGLTAAAYHADMSPTARQLVHNNWLTDRCRIVVATLAFGRHCS